MDFYSVIMDFFWVSVILFVAKIIREHVKILQNFFIPVSLIAGFIAILLLSRLHTGGDLHPAFGWLIPVSFLGGTGPAIAAGQVLDKYGFSDFTGLGITAAAYGMLLGLIGGIIMTKLATKRGYSFPGSRLVMPF